MAMARNDVYKGRGLKLPKHLLKHDGEPDLCSSCAKGKPTITRSHIRRQRASKKGGLWFFDVSGGGKRVPSLIEGNIYLYLFVDSYSRKYFPYYSKKRDEKETLRIMKLHFETSIVGFVQHDDEVVYHQVTSIQGDKKTTEEKWYFLTKVRRIGKADKIVDNRGKRENLGFCSTQNSRSGEKSKPHRI